MITHSQKRQRINGAIDYINANLAHSHSLDELASHACYSPFHFLRTFREMTRQTPMQFVLNERLDRAARILIYSNNIRVSDVGISCGFSSSQHLSKAFKSVFGLSPRDATGNQLFLHAKTSPQLLGNTDETPTADCFPDEQKGNSGVEIVDLPDYRVGYFRTIGPYDPQTLEEWFDRMVEWIGIHTPQSVMFGVPRSLPAITPHWRCVHEICGVLPDNVKPPPGMSQQVLRGGLNAVYRTEVGYDALYLNCRRIWTWLTHIWLPSSPYQPDDRPAFEVYVRNPQGEPGQVIEFCLPIRRCEDNFW